MSTRAVLDDVDLLARHDRDGPTRSAPSSPKMRRGDLVGEVDLEALDVAGLGVAGGEPERVLVDADAQPAALADLGDRPPRPSPRDRLVGPRLAVASSPSSHSRWLGDVVVVASTAGSATVVSGTGSGRASRTRRRPTAARLARTPRRAATRRGRHGRRRASPVLPQPRPQPDHDGDAGRDRGEDDHDRQRDARVAAPDRPPGRAPSTTRSMRSASSSSTARAASASRVDGDVDGGRVVASLGETAHLVVGGEVLAVAVLERSASAARVAPSGAASPAGRAARRRRRGRGCRCAASKSSRYSASVPRSMRSRFSSLSDRSVRIRAVDSDVTRSHPSSRDSASASA